MLHLHDLHRATLHNTWLTIGVFDGVHRGHQTLIEGLVTAAHAAQEQAVVITFYPHPAVVLGRRQSPQYLTTPDERVEILEKLGVDVVIVQKFDLQLAQLSARAYMQLVKQHTGLKQLWIGHDFALGHDREGNAQRLFQLGQEMGFAVNIIEPLRNTEYVVSSSQIRQLLSMGEVSQAARLLGRPYMLQGEVIPGDQRGRLIGVPTANLQINPEKIVPGAGVYACRATLQGKFFAAATNIGVRPTFEEKTEGIHVEAHLLDFSGDLYGQNLRLEFIEFLRDEEKFSGIEALVAQIQQDIERTRQIVLI